MLTFEEFQKKAAQTADKRLYLSLEQQKECYKWYLKGARELICQVLCKVEDECDLMQYCEDCCPKHHIYDVDDELRELEEQNAQI